MRVQNTSSDLMDILTKKSKNEKIQDTNFSETFCRILQDAGISVQGLAEENSNGGLFRYPKYVSNPMTSYTRTTSAITDQTAWRDSDAYMLLRDNIINADEIQFTEDMLEETPEGVFLNEKGREFEKKWRIDNLMSIAPSSINEANSRYISSMKNLNDYVHSEFIANGIQTEMFMDHSYNGKVSFLGMQRFADDRDAARYREFLNSPKGQEILVMSEEVVFYGAISQMAENNPEFQEEFNRDPSATIDKYYSYIAEKMNDITLPHINTIQNDKKLLLS